MRELLLMLLAALVAVVAGNVSSALTSLVVRAWGWLGKHGTTIQLCVVAFFAVLLVFGLVTLLTLVKAPAPAWSVEVLAVLAVTLGVLFYERRAPRPPA